MRKIFKVGLAAAVLCAAGVAVAWVTSPLTWGTASATFINADAGALGSNAFQSPNVPLGVLCTIATPGGSMNGGVVYTPSFFQQVSNDQSNWVSLDAGFAPIVSQAVSDAGPYQYPLILVPTPYQYSRVATSAITAAGQLSCTAAHP